MVKRGRVYPLQIRLQMGKKKGQATPGTIRQGYTFLWYRGGASYLTTHYPVEMEIGDSFMDDRPPWICLRSSPSLRKGSGHSYKPFVDEPLLHRKFAGIDQTQNESVLDFVNKYGLLGVNPVLESAGVYIESLERWKFEIKEMRGLLKLLDIYRSVKGEDPQNTEDKALYIERDEVLQHLVHHRGKSKYIVFDWRYYEKGKAYPNCQPIIDIKHDFTTSDIRELIVDQITTKMANTVVFEINARDLTVIYEPTALLSAMYSMFLIDEIIYGSEPRQCYECHKLFTTQDKRQIYCEPRCKYKAHRGGRSRIRRTASLP